MSDDKQLLSVLLQKGITPNFSFPLNTCQFSAVGVEGFRPHRFANMTQDLRNALREYSPGKEISVDGNQYTVGGLSFFNPADKVNHAAEMLGPESRTSALKWYSRCSERDCGWVYGDIESPYSREGEETNCDCPLCGSKASDGKGVVSSRWLKPEGFAPIIVPFDKDGQELRSETQGYTKFMKPQQHGRRAADRQSSSGRVELPAPLVNDHGEAGEDENERMLKPIEIEHSPFGNHVRHLVSRGGEEEDITEPGIQLILMNTGYNGRGYWVCSLCGRTEVLRPASFGRGDGGHYRPYAPQFPEGVQKRRCNAEKIFGLEDLPTLMFGMTFRTDMAILRIPFDERFNRPEQLARNKELDSGIRALKEAMLSEINEVYEFEDREISAGFRKWIRNEQNGDEQNTRSLVLDLFFYDEVPGGAGLSTYLFSDTEKWNEAIKNTEIRLNGDRCSTKGGCDSACNGCLLDFRNSQDHNRMNRKNGLRLLRWLKDTDCLPTLESGDADPTSGLALSDLKSLFNCPPNCEIEAQNGLLTFKDKGQKVFYLRPKSSLLRKKSQPEYIIDKNNIGKVKDNLELGKEPSERDSGIAFYVPMMDVSDLAVRLEQRIFGSPVYI